MIALFFAVLQSFFLLSSFSVCAFRGFITPQFQLVFHAVFSSQYGKNTPFVLYSEQEVRIYA